MNRLRNHNELNEFIIDKLTSHNVEEESESILPELITINQLNFTTFESQPTELSRISRDMLWRKRAYLNGIYYRELLPCLVEQLLSLDPDIIVSETLLNPNGVDTLQLYNIRDEDYDNAVWGLYPMAESYTKNHTEYHQGYSGNISKPAYREDYMDDFNDDLLEDIYNNKFSLVQIWSRNIKTNIFPIIIEALENCS